VLPSPLRERLAAVGQADDYADGADSADSADSADDADDAGGVGPVDGDGIGEPEELAAVTRQLRAGKRPSVVGWTLLFALGAGVAYVLFRIMEQLRTILVMVALALLIALTLDPLVAMLERRGLRRWVAAFGAWLAAGAVLLAPIVLAIDAATSQLPTLIDNVPNLINNAENNLGSLGDRLRTITSSSSTSANVTPDKVVTYVLRGGQIVFDAFADIAIVGALSLWLLIALPQILDLFYRLLPFSRRTAVRRVGDDVLSQISRFMLTNVLTSVLAGIATSAWTWAFGVPYPILLGSLVAVLDLIPTVGSTIGGAIVTLVSLTVGLPTALATLIFYVAFRLTEDYVIQPKALRYSVELPGVITVPAVLVGGALLGIPGALFAVPVALIVRVLVRDVARPALDRR
jgi:predicted PurR-regulated permease PerM